MLEYYLVIHDEGKTIFKGDISCRQIPKEGEEIIIPLRNYRIDDTVFYPDEEQEVEIIVTKVTHYIESDFGEYTKKRNTKNIVVVGIVV